MYIIQNHTILMSEPKSFKKWLILLKFLTQNLKLIYIKSRILNYQKINKNDKRASRVNQKKQSNFIKKTVHSLKLCDFGLCTYLALLMSKILRKK